MSDPPVIVYIDASALVESRLLAPLPDPMGHFVIGDDATGNTRLSTLVGVLRVAGLKLSVRSAV